MLLPSALPLRICVRRWSCSAMLMEPLLLKRLAKANVKGGDFRTGGWAAANKARKKVDSKDMAGMIATRT